MSGKVKVNAWCKETHLKYILPILDKADLSITELVCSVVRVFYGFCLDHEITDRCTAQELNKAFNEFFRTQIEVGVENEHEPFCKE